MKFNIYKVTLSKLTFTFGHKIIPLAKKFYMMGRRLCTPALEHRKHEKQDIYLNDNDGPVLNPYPISLVNIAFAFVVRQIQKFFEKKRDVIFKITTLRI